MGWLTSRLRPQLWHWTRLKHCLSHWLSLLLMLRTPCLPRLLLRWLLRWLMLSRLLY